MAYEPADWSAGLWVSDFSVRKDARLFSEHFNTVHFILNSRFVKKDDFRLFLWVRVYIFHTRNNLVRRTKFPVEALRGLCFLAFKKPFTNKHWMLDYRLFVLPFILMITCLQPPQWVFQMGIIWNTHCLYVVRTDFGTKRFWSLIGL